MLEMKMNNDSYYIKDYFNRLKETLDKCNILAIEKFINVLLNAYENDSTIYIFGNGGSSANASHFCGDLIKGVSCGLSKRFKAICLNDNLPSLLAIANDNSFEDIFVEQLKNFLKKDDVVICISCSGNSMNVLKAASYAKENEAKVIGLTGFDGGKLKEYCDINLNADINDMEVSEDIQIIVLHCVKQIFKKKLTRE